MTTLDAHTVHERWDSDRDLRRRAWTAVAVASTSQLLYMVDAALIALALPALQREWPDVPRTTIGWAAGGFLVAQASLLLVGGRLGDRRGRKRNFLFGMILFAVGALCTALAPNVELLIAARVVQGCGAAFLTSGALALVLPMFPVSRTAVVIGAWGVVGSVAAWATPPLASLIVEHNWRIAFAMVLPITVAAFALGRRVLVESVSQTAPLAIDWLEYLLGPAALGLTMVVLANGPSWGWATSATVVTAAVAVVLLTLFAWRSVVAEAPLLDIDVVRNRIFRLNLWCGSMQQMGFFAWFLTAPLIMSEMWGWSIREIGLALAVGQVLATLASPLGGQVVLRWGSTVAIVAGAACCVVGATWGAATIAAEADLWGSYLPMALLLGFGGGMCGTVTTGASLAALPHHSLGAGNSIVQLVRRMSGAIGVAVGLALLGERSGDALLSGAQRTWWFVAALHAIVILPALLASSPASRPSSAEEMQR